MISRPFVVFDQPRSLSRQDSRDGVLVSTGSGQYAACSWSSKSHRFIVTACTVLGPKILVHTASCVGRTRSRPRVERPWPSSCALLAHTALGRCKYWEPLPVAEGDRQASGCVHVWRRSHRNPTSLSDASRSRLQVASFTVIECRAALCERHRLPASVMYTLDVVQTTAQPSF